jgi:uncharacterized membrane protein YcaP (DUF421 family)
MEMIERLLGLNRQAQDLSVLNVSLRALVVFVVGLLILRIGNRRFMGKATAFDVLLGILIGAVLSRAINGTAAFVPTLVGSLVIVLLHRGLAALVYFVPAFATVAEGRPLPLVEAGAVRRANARRARITDQDLQEALRLNGIEKLEDVSKAYLEPDGSISMVPKIILTEPVDIDEARNGKRLQLQVSIR